MGRESEIEYGSRSTRQAQPWDCVCKARNLPRRKLVFDLPKFNCGCGRKFLDKHGLDFCLADVRVNSELLVHRIFQQEGPECIANAMCQVMLIMDTVKCIMEDIEVEKAMENIDPREMVKSYIKEYPLMNSGEQQSSVHKFIKMALRLKNQGTKLKDGTVHQIGDISFLPTDDYEGICEELANGVPLLAIFPPGVNFKDLGYCQIYRPPLLQDFHDCNQYHKSHDEPPHEAHMVVLLGPAFKDKKRGFYFANSHGVWCPRDIVEDSYDDQPDVLKAVNHDIGKIEQEGLVYSVVKFWPYGESAGPDSVRLEDEDENEATKYENYHGNIQKFKGDSFPRARKSMKHMRVNGGGPGGTIYL